MDELEVEEFGPNAWLVDELFRRFEADPGSVGPAWREFFEGYRPRAGAVPAPPPGPAGDGRATPEGWRALGPSDVALARAMDDSLTVPTATSVRTVPAKLLEVNRRRLNRYLSRATGVRVSFTHLISWAVVRATASSPPLRRVFQVVDGRPGLIERPHVDLGIAVDRVRPDGTRTLLVPTVRGAEALGFEAFHAAYEQLVSRARAGRIGPDELSGALVTITNPGVAGTNRSVPRLPAGQAAIVGLGAIGPPAAFAGADPERLAEVGVGPVVTITCTYDHRVIQGAESGAFLALVERLLLGEDDFYGDVFGAMHAPFRPIRWAVDAPPERTAEGARRGAIQRLVNNYRVRGHLIADLDPLATAPPKTHPELDPATLGFTPWDLGRRFDTDGIGGVARPTLEELWDLLRDAYCGTLAVEYMHIQEPAQKRWIQERVEGAGWEIGPDDRRRILTKLNEAEAFERFLHTKYLGHKRFSLEGAESLIPMLDALMERAADEGVSEVIMGMSHRGRLNVLANVIGKGYGEIFREFEGELPPESIEGTGDVRYHLGAEGTFTARSGRQLRIRLASNPSHLESVDPVVEGMVRAKLDARSPDAGVLPLLIHGEAAFAGQGVVAETLNLSQLPGYRTGGTVHVVVNNQLGFTAPKDQTRSSTYATDVAKMVQAPIFHVNGDDPEACVRAVRLAFAFRQAFRKDVVVDLWCYRRWGHNEADEPSFTQPLMYRRIAELRSVRKRYTETLLRRGDLTLEDAERALEAFDGRLAQAFEETREEPPVSEPPRRAPHPHEVAPEPRTAVPREVLDRVMAALTTLPEGFHAHPKIAAGLERRGRALDEDAVDWALGEALAFGTLLLDGVTVRLAGQDSRRGTFSQRHAVVVDQETAAEHVPLTALVDEAAGTGRFHVYDSSLSELAAMAFEYGYSVAAPGALVLWEAQFGDFANGGQVLIDQYLVAAEEKWGQTSGLVLLLPHGYEGQGPEHSSARPERFLELEANGNLEVVVPSTPAQLFHLLRRQALRERRRPLAVMTPKSLLRAPAARSRTAELTGGAFAPVLPDPSPPATVARVVVCQGKLFYELDEARRDRGVGVALVRLERCAPFPADELHRAIAAFGGVPTIWAQEEPENMGAGRSVLRNLRDRLGIEATMVARAPSGSPATGSLRVHQREQAELIRRALAP